MRQTKSFSSPVKRPRRDSQDSNDSTQILDSPIQNNDNEDEERKRQLKELMEVVQRQKATIRELRKRVRTEQTKEVIFVATDSEAEVYGETDDEVTIVEERTFETQNEVDILDGLRLDKLSEQYPGVHYTDAHITMMNAVRNGRYHILAIPDETERWSCLLPFLKSRKGTVNVMVLPYNGLLLRFMCFCQGNDISPLHVGSKVDRWRRLTMRQVLDDYDVILTNPEGLVYSGETQDFILALSENIPRAMFEAVDTVVSQSSYRKTLLHLSNLCDVLVGSQVLLTTGVAFPSMLSEISNIIKPPPETEGSFLYCQQDVKLFENIHFQAYKEDPNYVSRIAIHCRVYRRVVVWVRSSHEMLECAQELQKHEDMPPVITVSSHERINNRFNPEYPDRLEEYVLILTVGAVGTFNIRDIKVESIFCLLDTVSISFVLALLQFNTGRNKVYFTVIYQTGRLIRDQPAGVIQSEFQAKDRRLMIDYCRTTMCRYRTLYNSWFPEEALPESYVCFRNCDNCLDVYESEYPNADAALDDTELTQNDIAHSETFVTVDRTPHARKIMLLFSQANMKFTKNQVVDLMMKSNNYKKTMLRMFPRIPNFVSPLTKKELRIIVTQLVTDGFLSETRERAGNTRYQATYLREKNVSRELKCIIRL